MKRLRHKIICFSVIIIGLFIVYKMIEFHAGIPNIKKAEFEFTLEYKIEGETKVISDTIICQYNGFGIHPEALYRKWKYYFKNTEEKEIVVIKHLPFITIKTLDDIKILMRPSSAGYFIGNPHRDQDDVKHITEPEIFIFDFNRYSTLTNERKEKIFNDLQFEIVSWKCDSPIENSFRHNLF